MKLFAYSVFDNVAGAFLPPFFLPSDSVAIRAFSNCANDDGHQFGKNSSDYNLFCVAEFDDSTGLLSGISPPKNLGLAAVYRSSNSEV